ncbi:PTS mannose transporter subunit IID, partial [Lactobacillus sp. XV13L]|nr:PTS mannose transporter subunit IID [Lactobacillus sp. XV13L]
MISVLVCTHGPAADGLLQTAEMICGKQEQCVALSFQMGESLDEFKQTVQKRLKQLSADSQSILCLVDLKGGTPFNTVVSLLPEYPNLEIVTG